MGVKRLPYEYAIELKVATLSCATLGARTHLAELEVPQAPHQRLLLGPHLLARGPALRLWILMLHRHRLHVAPNLWGATSLLYLR